MPRRRSKWNILAQIAGGAGKALLERWQAEQEYGRSLGLLQKKAEYDNVGYQFQRGESARQRKHEIGRDATAAQVGRTQATLESALRNTEAALEEDRPSAQAATALATGRAGKIKSEIEALDHELEWNQLRRRMLPEDTFAPDSSISGSTSGVRFQTSPEDISLVVNELAGLGNEMRGLFDSSIEISPLTIPPGSPAVAPRLVAQESPAPPGQPPEEAAIDDPVVTIAGERMPCSELGWRISTKFYDAPHAAREGGTQCPGYKQSREAEAAVDRDLAASTPEMMEGMTGVGAPMQRLMSPKDWTAMLEGMNLPETLRTPMPANEEDPLHWEIMRSKAIDEYVAKEFVLPFDDSSAAVLSEVPRLRQIVATLADFRTDDTGIPGTGLWLLGSDHGPVDRAWQGMQTWVDMNVTRGGVAAAQYAAILQGYVASLAGVGGEGANRLSDQDIVRARTLIPRPNDSLEVANALIGQLNRAITAMQSPLLSLELYPATTPEERAARMQAGIDEARAVLWEPLGNIPGLTEAESLEAAGDVKERMCDDAGETVRMIYGTGRVPDESIDPSRICA